MKSIQIFHILIVLSLLVSQTKVSAQFGGCSISGGGNECNNFNTTYYYPSSDCSLITITPTSGRTYTEGNNEVTVYWTSAGDYHIEVSCPCDVISKDVTVFEEPVGGSVDPVTTCSGQSVTISATGYVSTIKAWQAKIGGQWQTISTTQNSSISVSPTTTTDYRVKVESNCNGISAYSNPGTVTVPTFDFFNLGGDANFCPGGGTALSIGSSGNPVESDVSYMLQKNGNDVPPSKPGASASGGVLTWESITQAGSYRVIGIRDNCSQEVTSQDFVVTELGATSFNVTGGGAYCEGETGVSITLQGSENGVRYELLLINGTQTVFKGAKTGTGGNLTWTNVTLATNSTFNFKVQAVKDEADDNCHFDMNNQVSVTKHPKPVVNNSSTSKTIQSCEKVNIGLTSSLTGTSFSWTSTVTSGNVSGNANGSGSTINDVLSGNGTVRYTVTPSTTHCTGPSKQFTVTVQPYLTFFWNNGFQTFCTDMGSVNLQMSGSESGVTYRLQKDGSLISGVSIQGDGNSITFTNIQNHGEGNYKAVVNKNGCTFDITTSSATVEIIQSPIRYTLTGGSYCADEDGADIVLSDSETDVMYQLKRGTISMGSEIPGTGGQLTWSNIMDAATNYRIVATREGTCETITFPDVEVSIDPLPATPTLGQIDAFCDHYEVHKSVSNTNWYWQTSMNKSTWNMNNNTDFTSINIDETAILAHWDGNCWSDAVTYTATDIGPGPVTITGETSVCVRGSTTLTASSTDAHTYIWYDNNDNLLQYGSTFTTPLLTTSAIFKVAAVKINGCESNQSIPVNVSPENTHQPNLHTLTKNGSNYELSVGTQDAGHDYYWVNGPDDETDTNSSSVLTTSTPGYYYLRPRDATSGCWGEAVSVLVPDLSLPTLNNPLDMNEVNFVRTFTFNQASTQVTYPSDLMTETDPFKLTTATDYIDGIGRPIQQVTRKAASGQKDLVVALGYDANNRQVRNFLPYGSASGDGLIKAQPLTDLGAFYNGTTAVATSGFPFSYREFEDSPLDQVKEESAPGDSWAALAVTEDARGVESRVSVNDASQMHLWQLDANGLPYSDGSYGANQLSVQVTSDEHGNQVKEYTNKTGQVVLKEVQGEAGEWLKTYYVYDEFSNLRYVFPPQVFANGDPEMGQGSTGSSDVEYITQNTNISAYADKSYRIKEGKVVKLMPGFSFSAATAGKNFSAKFGPPVLAGILDEFAFQYRYDNKNRMVAKKVPGAEWVNMVYDQWDRLVLTQDGEQDLSDEWTFTKYDALNRPILTGKITDDRSASTIQSALESETVRFETLSTGAGNTEGYTNTAFPTVIDEVLTVTYFDNYDFLTAGWDVENNDYTFVGELGHSAEHTQVKGQVTGSKTKIIGAGTFLNSVTYYDDRYRVIQAITENQQGTTDRLTSAYDFVGKVLETQLTHVGAETITTHETFEYDHAGRLKQAWHQTNSEPSVLTVENTYNELGELIDKKLHSEDGGASFLQSVDYRYNIRGWLTSVNNAQLANNSTNDDDNDLFGMELAYDDANQYNGNIGAMKWTNVVDDVLKEFDYTYDPLNRLKSADYSENAVASAKFDVPQISYDHNGNILNLQRKGRKSTLNDYGLIDDLSYSYQGNQLKAVEDAIAESIGLGADFKNKASNTTEYSYDKNGNMVSDDNKGITAITYNHLNLPREITFDTGNKILYIYDAAGVKLQKQVIEGTDTTFTDYIGGFVYENDTLQFLQTAEGRVVKYPNLASMKEWAYQYHLKDHLGNVRLTFGEPVAIIYEATMESEEAAFEEAVFEQILETRHLDQAFNHTPNGNESALLNASGEVVGPAKSLEVFAGDTVKMEVYAKYTEPSSNTYDGAITGMAGEIAGAFGNPVVTEGGQYLSEVVDVALAGGAAFSSGDNNVPRIYLQYLLFDKDYVLHQSGFVQISSSANGTGAPFDHLVLDVPIDKSGFIYIYTANETDNPAVNAYFDDLKITHKQMVVQADDYYPFGLSMESLSYKRFGGKGNDFKFNSKEADEELGLNWYAYGFRNYDPQLGRWHVKEPLADLMAGISPYTYAYNNPVVFRDLMGLMPGQNRPSYLQSALDTSADSDGDGFVTPSEQFIFDNNNEGGGFDFAKEQNQRRKNKVSLPGGRIIQGDGTDDELFRVIEHDINRIHIFYKSYFANMQNSGNAYFQAAKFAAFLSQTSLVVNETRATLDVINTYRNSPRTKLQRAFPRHFKGNSKAVNNSLKALKVAKSVGRNLARPFFFIAVGLSTVDAATNPSASNIIWNGVDIGVGAAALGLAATPVGWIVGVGATVYFTGRLAYDLYDVYNEGN